jgi:serine/threonine-protein kinase
MGAMEAQLKPPAPPLDAAMLAGRYEIVREIGRGGMASVHLATDRKHDRQVAVKLLLPDLSAAIGAERFAREIKLLARLQHPHILPLHDSGEAGGVLFFVMPFVDGQSLRGILTDAGTIALTDATRTLRQIADALDYAHERGIVHRDLKPENILLAGTQAFLADFGVARIAADGTNETLTAVGMTLGTPAYMSPEQATGEREIDGRSDVYSLACVCYEMLSGAPPFSGTTMAVLSQHVMATPAPVVTMGSELPPAVVAAVARALEKDPARRFATAGAFVAELEAAAAAARAPSPNDARLQALEQRSRARHAVLVLDFANIAAADDVDWLSGGIRETLSVDLQKIGEIRVVAMDAATRQRLDAERKQPVDATRALELGRSLGARWVVWGGFQKAGPRIRLTPQFADTESGAVVSSEKIDGAMDDIFALQDRIVSSLVDVLRIRLTSEEREQIAKPETVNLSAYEYYVRGQQAYAMFSLDGARQAEEYFRKALEIDPNYALAHAGLGGVAVPRYIAFGREEDLDAAVNGLQRAVDLDPAYGQPHAYIAYMRMRQHRHDDAIRSARAAVERDPANNWGWYLLGCALMSRGIEDGSVADLEHAVGPLLRARAIDPEWHPPQQVLGGIYLLRGQYGHAAAMIDEAVARERANAGYLFLGGSVLRAMLSLNSGDLTRARESLAVPFALYPKSDHVYAQAMHAFAQFATGCIAEREDRLDDALVAFQASCAIAESNSHRLSMGAHWVKGRAGMARVLHRMGRPDDSAAAFAEGQRLFETRTGYVWGWFTGASEADMSYELAAAHATAGDDDQAVKMLQRAIDFGWADRQQLNHDPAFAVLRERDDVRRMTAAASELAFLPPPVGRGGMPASLSSLT